MKDNLYTVLHDNIIRLSLVLSVVIISINSVLILFVQSHFPPVVPFFNSFPWGEERLVRSGYIMIIPPILILFFLLNNLLSVALYKKHTLLSRILSFNALLFVMLGFLAFLQILFLIF